MPQGVPQYFQDLPGTNKVESELGLDESQISALPTQVLNVPPYGNWSNGAWNVRFRGNVRTPPSLLFSTAGRSTDDGTGVQAT